MAGDRVDAGATWQGWPNRTVLPGVPSSMGPPPSEWNDDGSLQDEEEAEEAWAEAGDYTRSLFSST
jgi:hypothetical protein